MFVRTLAVLAACSLASGCSAFVACTDDLSYRVSPTSSTLAIGQTFTATAEFRGCRGSKHLDDTISWETADSTIAIVNASSGQVTGRSPGTTQVQARRATYGLAWPPIAVTVH